MAEIAAAPPHGLRQMVRDLAGLSPGHWFILLVAVGLQMVEGFDLNGMGFAGSSIARTMHMAPDRLGLVFSGAQFGSLFGAAAVMLLGSGGAPRKAMLILATVLLSAGCLATMLAWNFELLLICRIVTGVGLGITMPLGIGYAAEFFSPRIRGSAAAVVVSAMQLGSVLAGLTAASLIPHFGWQSLFLVGGLAPLALLPVVLRLPAALADQVRAGVDRDRLEALCRDYGLSLSDVVDAPDRAAGQRAAPLERRYWVPILAVLLCVLAGSSGGTFMMSWLPKLIEDRGLSLPQAALCTSFIGTGAIVGILLIGPLMDRRSPYLVMGWTFVGAVAFVGLLSVVAATPLAVYPLCFGAGVCAIGGAMSTYGFVNVTIPNRVRVSAMGMVTTGGRVGGLLAPAGAGLFLSLGLPPKDLFLIAGALMLWASLSMLIPGYIVGRRR